MEDLFVAGIGFDIAGAWLLARGLLASSDELALRTASLWGGNPAAVAGQIDDRIRGTIGVAALIAGFAYAGGRLRRPGLVRRSAFR